MQQDMTALDAEGCDHEIDGFAHGRAANQAAVAVAGTFGLGLLLAVVLPGNRMLPFGDLAALPFYILWGVAASRGNMVRGLINAIVILQLAWMCIKTGLEAYRKRVAA